MYLHTTHHTNCYGKAIEEEVNRHSIEHSIDFKARYIFTHIMPYVINTLLLLLINTHNINTSYMLWYQAYSYCCGSSLYCHWFQGLFANTNAVVSSINQVWRVAKPRSKPVLPSPQWWYAQTYSSCTRRSLSSSSLSRYILFQRVWLVFGRKRTRMQ